ncbi:MAG: serine hydrolase [Clostridia bacterium]|nr:serine hydrolase [Clostridia bacterium]
MNALHWENIEKAAGELRLLGIRVHQDGRERDVRLWDEECRRNIYSASKSVTALAVGIAIQEGLLALDEKLTEAFARDMPACPDENLSKATVRDLLTMCLGQKKAMLMGGQRPKIQEEDWVKLAFSVPFTDVPGTRFCYNNAGPYLAGMLVQRRCGCDLVQYLRPRMFDRMGIRNPTWEHDPLGNTFGAGGLFLSLEELHRIGVLCLQEGVWDGKRIVDAQWIRECGKKQVENGREGYGYLFWRGPANSYRADGKYGQWSIVLKDWNAVVTVTAECRCTDRMQEVLFSELVPQLMR